MVSLRRLQFWHSILLKSVSDLEAQNLLRILLTGSPGASCTVCTRQAFCFWGQSHVKMTWFSYGKQIRWGTKNVESTQPNLSTPPQTKMLSFLMLPRHGASCKFGINMSQRLLKEMLDLSLQVGCICPSGKQKKAKFLSRTPCFSNKCSNKLSPCSTLCKNVISMIL